jgi:hypothetical protein
MDPDDWYLITDIDMIPLARSFFVDWMATHDPGKMYAVDYANTLVQHLQLPICYIMGAGALWQQLVEIRDMADIYGRYQEWEQVARDYQSVHNGRNWTFDQQWLTKQFLTFEHGVVMGYTGLRLERFMVVPDHYQKLRRAMEQQVIRDYHIYACEASSLTERERSEWVLEQLRQLYGPQTT